MIKQGLGITRSCSFDQVSFPLITNMYTQTVDHIVDVKVMCWSLSLCSWQASTEAAISSNSFELQLFTCHNQQSLLNMKVTYITKEPHNLTKVTLIWSLERWIYNHKQVKSSEKRKSCSLEEITRAKIRNSWSLIVNGSVSEDSKIIIHAAKNKITHCNFLFDWL